MRRSNTKEKLFHAAVRLFSENGYHSVSMREIAAAVGITEAAIYRHFENKEAILNEILAVFKRKLEGYLLTKSQVDTYIEADTTRRLLQRCIGRFTEEDTLFMIRAYRIVYMEHLTNEAAMDLIISHLHDATAKSIRYVLDKLIERGRIPTLDTCFFSMLWTQSMFSGAVVWLSHYIGGYPEEASAAEYNAVAERLVDMAMSGKVP